MHRALVPVLAALAGLSRAACAAPGCPAIPPRSPMPIEATPHTVQVPGWEQRVAQLTAQASGRSMAGVRLVFIGDSIIQGWEPTTWNLFWGGRSALNLGVSSDLTQGVLWRLNNGQWPASLKPDTAVLLIGTNNANWKSRPEDTALGIAEIVRFIRGRSPATKVLILGLLPRGADRTSPERAVNARVNDLIRDCADDQKVVFLDPGRWIVDANGSISQQVLFDYLHPTMVGYAILAAAIAAHISQKPTP